MRKRAAERNSLHEFRAARANGRKRLQPRPLQRCNPLGRDLFLFPPVCAQTGRATGGPGPRGTHSGRRNGTSASRVACKEVSVTNTHQSLANVNGGPLAPLCALKTRVYAHNAQEMSGRAGRLGRASTS
jgi:hypothetical protein